MKQMAKQSDLPSVPTLWVKVTKDMRKLRFPFQISKYLFPAIANKLLSCVMAEKIDLTAEQGRLKSNGP